MNKKMLVAAGVIALALALPYACKTTKTTANNCSTVSAKYSTDIKPIIDANCIGCHGVGSRKGDFTTYEGLKVVAGKGELREHVLELKDMPPKGPLSEADQQKISCWLSSGFPNN